MKVGKIKLLLKIGMGIIIKDVHEILISGTVSKILHNTIIVSKGADNYLVKKRELTRQGFIPVS